MERGLFSRYFAFGAVVLSMLVVMFIFLCKSFCKSRDKRNRNGVAPEAVQIIPKGEPQEPSNEEATEQTNAPPIVPRRRRSRPQDQDNMPSDNVNNDGRINTDTQLNGESTGNTGEDGNERNGGTNVGNFSSST